MKQKFLLIFLILSLCISLLGCNKKPDEEVPSENVAENTLPREEFVPEGETIQLGIVASLTGYETELGTSFLNGAKLAVEEINAKGGVNGRELELIVEDESDDIKVAMEAALRLFDNNNILGVVGSITSNNTLALMDTTLGAKIPFITCGSADAIANPDYTYLWQHRNKDSEFAKALVYTTHDKLDMKNPAILYTKSDPNDFSVSVVRKFYGELFNIYIPDRMIFPYSPEEENLPRILAEAVATGADGLISISYDRQQILISKTLEEAQIDLPHFGNSFVSSPDFLEGAGSSANGWYAVSDWYPGLENGKAEFFLENYIQRFDTMPSRVSAFSYDAVYLFYEAMQHAGDKLCRRSINEGLAKIKNYPAVLGDMTATENRDFLDSVYIITIKDDAIVLVDELEYR